MDKHRAQIEIESIFWSIKHDDKTPKQQKELLEEILQNLQSYNYNLGKRHGMFKAVNLLTEFAEKEGKTNEK